MPQPSEGCLVGNDGDNSIKSGSKVRVVMVLSLIVGGNSRDRNSRSN